MRPALPDLEFSDGVRGKLHSGVGSIEDIRELLLDHFGDPGHGEAQGVLPACNPLDGCTVRRYGEQLGCTGYKYEIFGYTPRVTFLGQWTATAPDGRKVWAVSVWSSSGGRICFCYDDRPDRWLG